MLKPKPPAHSAQKSKLLQKNSEKFAEKGSANNRVLMAQLTRDLHTEYSVLNKRD